MTHMEERPQLHYNLRNRPEINKDSERENSGPQWQRFFSSQFV